MTESPNDELSGKHASTRYSEVIQMLRSLEGKDDAESDRTRMELLDELMCLDMSLGPCRKAMAEAAKRRNDDAQREP